VPKAVFDATTSRASVVSERLPEKPLLLPDRITSPVRLALAKRPARGFAPPPITSAAVPETAPLNSTLPPVVAKRLLVPMPFVRLMVMEPEKTEASAVAPPIRTWPE
jgi:hypothetical protein